MSVESLNRIKNYIKKQIIDIGDWAENDEESYCRIDELQCLETFVDYLIAKDTGTLDEHYDKLIGDDK